MAVVRRKWRSCCCAIGEDGRRATKQAANQLPSARLCRLPSSALVPTATIRSDYRLRFIFPFPPPLCLPLPSVSASLLPLPSVSASLRYFFSVTTYQFAPTSAFTRPPPSLTPSSLVYSIRCYKNKFRQFSHAFTPRQITLRCNAAPL